MYEERDNPALEKSYAFALQVIALVRELQEKHSHSPLFEQILLAGTSIGAHVEDGVGAQPGPDFLPHMNQAYNAARVSRYRLRLLHDSGYIDSETFHPLLSNCEELLKILGSICKSSKNRRY